MMKKLILFAAVIVFAVFTTSCKKDYTCKCDWPNGESKLELNTSKKDAQDKCDDEEQIKKTTIHSEANCSLDD